MANIKLQTKLTTTAKAVPQNTNGIIPSTSDVKALDISNSTLPLREDAFVELEFVEFVSLAKPPDKFFISNYAN